MNNKYLKWTSLMLLFCALGVSAGETDENKQKKAATQKTEQAPTPQPEAAAKTTAPGGAGMIYTLDSARGGEVQLSEEMRDALSEMINTSSDGLVEQTHPDGTVTVDLKGRFQSAMVVSIGKDGKLESSCLSQDPNHDHKHDHAKAVTPTPEVKAKKKDKN